MRRRAGRVEKESAQPVSWVGMGECCCKMVIDQVRVTYECEFVLHRIDFAVVFCYEVE